MKKCYLNKKVNLKKEKKKEEEKEDCPGCPKTYSILATAALSGRK